MGASLDGARPGHPDGSDCLYLAVAHLRHDRCTTRLRRPARLYQTDHASFTMCERQPKTDQLSAKRVLVKGSVFSCRRHYAGPLLRNGPIECHPAPDLGIHKVRGSPRISQHDLTERELHHLTGWRMRVDRHEQGRPNLGVRKPASDGSNQLRECAAPARTTSRTYIRLGEGEHLLRATTTTTANRSCSAAMTSPPPGR